MPTYAFKNNDTNEEYTDFMSISELEVYLQENNVTQLVNGAPMIVSGRGMGKPDAGFRDILKKIKKESSKGIQGSTVNTF
jgi:hypothetical protein